MAQPLLAEPFAEPCDPETCPGCWYGHAPHVGVVPGVGHVNLALPREQWPHNFEEDAEEPGMGVYHCAGCCECGAEP